MTKSNELIDQNTLSLNDSALSILVNHPIAQAHSLTGRECKELLRAIGVCSEILDDEENRLFDIIYAAMSAAAKTPLSLVDVADAGLQALKPYLRTTKPVLSVHEIIEKHIQEKGYTGICSKHQGGEDKTCAICYPEQPDGLTIAQLGKLLHDAACIHQHEQVFSDGRYYKSLARAVYPYLRKPERESVDERALQSHIELLIDTYGSNRLAEMLLEKLEIYQIEGGN